MTTPGSETKGRASHSPPPRAPSRRYDRSIVDGPLSGAIWKLAWPTMLTNVIGGVQGMIDHAMVGHFVGFRANAAIGVATQIWIVVIVFMMSVFTGMSVLVARFSLVGAAGVGVLFLLFPRQLLGLFGLEDPLVVELGKATAAPS